MNIVKIVGSAARLFLAIQIASITLITSGTVGAIALVVAVL